MCNAHSHPFTVSLWDSVTFLRTFQVLLTGLRPFAVVQYVVVLPSYVGFGRKKALTPIDVCVTSISSCAYQDSEYEFDIFVHCDNLGSMMCSEATVSQQCRTLAVNSCRQNASAIMWKIKSSFSRLCVFRRRNYLFLHPFQLPSRFSCRTLCISTIKKTCMLFTVITHEVSSLSAFSTECN